MSVEILKYYQTKLQDQTDTIQEQAAEIQLMCQFLIDLLDPDCPEQYKSIVKSELEKLGKGD